MKYCVIVICSKCRNISGTVQKSIHQKQKLFLYKSCYLISFPIVAEMFLYLKVVFFEDNLKNKNKFYFFNLFFISSVWSVYSDLLFSSLNCIGTNNLRLHVICKDWLFRYVELESSHLLILPLIWSSVTSLNDRTTASKKKRLFSYMWHYTDKSRNIIGNSDMQSEIKNALRLYVETLLIVLFKTEV